MNVLVLNCSPVQNAAAAEIVRAVSEYSGSKFKTKCIYICNYAVQYYKGCRGCHITAVCVQRDGVDEVMEQYEWADVIDFCKGI